MGSNAQEVADCFINAELEHTQHCDARVHEFIEGHHQLRGLSPDEWLAAAMRMDPILRWEIAHGLNGVRGNSVAHYLDNGSDWRLETVPIDCLVCGQVVVVRQVLSGPELEAACCEWAGILGHRIVQLAGLAMVREMFARPPETIGYRTIIGVDRGEYIQVIDGVHRSVALARAGVREINVWRGKDL